jgi:hypothetical protein
MAPIFPCKEAYEVAKYLGPLISSKNHVKVSEPDTGSIL